MSEMLFSERAYKVVLALNAEYGCNMEGQPATEIVELAMRAVEADARAAGYAEAIEIVNGYYAIGEHAIIARLRAAATTEGPK